MEKLRVILSSPAWKKLPERIGDHTGVGPGFYLQAGGRNLSRELHTDRPEKDGLLKRATNVLDGMVERARQGDSNPNGR
jgi:hypothetical protein